MLSPNPCSMIISRLESGFADAINSLCNIIICCIADLHSTDCLQPRRVASEGACRMEFCDTADYKSALHSGSRARPKPSTDSYGPRLLSKPNRGPESTT